VKERKVTEQEADALLDGSDKVHVIPSDMMGMMKLLYNRQALILSNYRELNDRFTKLIEGMMRDEVISPQTASEALDRIL
jgi:hypothetical protein